MSAARMERMERLGRVIGGVVRQAVADAHAHGILLLDADTVEGRLAEPWCSAVLPGRVFREATGAPLLTAHPASKTVLLLEGAPAAALLPLGDLYASEVLELAPDWSVPAGLRALADAAGGVVALDGALREWAEGRTSLEAALRALPAGAAAEAAERLGARRWARWRGGLVPKLGARTLGIDLWE